MRLLVKIPTRSRPDRFLKTFRAYKTLARNPETFFLISVDRDDETMGQDFWDKFYAEFGNHNVTHVSSESWGKIEAINRDISSFIDGFDVLLVGQDDMIPQKQGYDNIIIADMRKYYPDTDGVLWYNDSRQVSIATLVVMGKKYWKRTEYVYHQSYKSLWCDNEYTDVAKRLGKIKYINNRIIEHHHPAWGGQNKMDELYNHNDTFWTEDQENYNARKKIGFPMEYKHGPQPILSILICTVVGREDLFEKLTKHLQKQRIDGVQIGYAKDNKEISIGAKRNNLLKASTGKYVVFIDDDDWVSDEYIPKIMEALEQGPDCVGFKIKCYTDGQDEQIAMASNRFKEWADNVNGFRYVRTIYHKTPVKRSIALKAMFPDERFGEDSEYSARMKRSGLLKKEVFIDDFLYYYRYSTKENHNEKYGINGR